MSYIESLFSLSSSVIIVTGAARGNGLAMTEAFLKAGATVFMVDIADELPHVCYHLRNEGKDAYYLQCDIAKDDDLDSLIDTVTQEQGRLDVLVNNAGVTYGHPSLEYPDELWESTYKVNLRAPYQLCKRAAPIMVKQGHGSIINITSINAELAFPDNPAYGSFKGGLKQLTKFLALDLGKYGIRVNNIVPGYFRTEMTAKSWADPEKNRSRSEKTMLGRWGHPGDLAGLAILLASPASAYITGQDFCIDGGWTSKGL